MNLPAGFLECLQGSMPSHFGTCAADGTPNATTVSQVFPAGPGQLAISNQFFSKSTTNVRENPFASVVVAHPVTGDLWHARLRYLRSETEGELFDMMEMHLEAVASAMGMSDVFQLQASAVFEVLEVERIYVTPQAG